MAKKLYWKCPRCGAGYEAYEGKKPLEDGICEDCGGELVETPYTSHDWLFGNGELTGSQVIDDIMENYIKPHPQYDPEYAKEVYNRKYNGEPFKSKQEQQNKNVPKCPICQSTNLKKISTAKKAGKIALFGVFGMGDNGKTWQCKNCGSKF